MKTKKQEKPLNWKLIRNLKKLSSFAIVLTLGFPLNTLNNFSKINPTQPQIATIVETNVIL